MNSSDDIQIGDRVKVLLDSKFWRGEGWFAGTVVEIEPYSAHRSFYWVELDRDVASMVSRGTNLISVLNPKKIAKIK